MGSNQSVNKPTEGTNFPSETPTESETKPRRQKQPPPNLSGPALVEWKCRKRKKAWNSCVGGWYNDRFLPGKALEDERSEQNCDELFEKFRHCYMRGMLTEQKKKGLKVEEGSMLAEFAEEEGMKTESDK
ncbi:unnamed protein product [Cylindrotheca closterium]|uniref:Uncharacterized protein n=1 Tax=Cylindrotheca closterium TaxID=2856 RepID=A0AAD2G472_9STRA|nr:unnamed protein product [Cylindrotheca closterium]